MDNIQDINKFIADTLEEHGITIIESYKKNSDHYFLCDAIIMIISHNKKKINISFHVAMTPDVATLVSLTISIKLNYSLMVNPVFIYDKDGIVIEGDKAVKLYRDEVNHSIIMKYVHEQQQLQLLDKLVPISPLVN